MYKSSKVTTLNIVYLQNGTILLKRWGNIKMQEEEQCSNNHQSQWNALTWS
jgi:hypothetical protein